MAQTAEQRTPRRIGEWAVPDAGYAPRDRLALLALIVVPAVLVALVAAVFTGWWWLAGLLLALWALKTFADAKMTDILMLRRLGARGLQPGEGARLRNISSGLSKDLGVPAPALMVIPEGGPNAWIRAGGKGGVLAVTATLLDTFTRTEIEAVVAHCLARMHGRDFVYSNLAARWSDLGAGLAPRIGTSHDARAVALTLYPPGLVDALEKADGKIRLYAPLWFVADAPSHQPVAERVAALSDL